MDHAAPIPRLETRSSASAAPGTGDGDCRIGERRFQSIAIVGQDKALSCDPCTLRGRCLGPDIQMKQGTDGSAVGGVGDEVVQGAGALEATGVHNADLAGHQTGFG